MAENDQHIKNYGLLINEHDIKLQRQWFKEATRLSGINCIYKALKPQNEWDEHGEMNEGHYYEPMLVGVFFQDHPDQKTLKKMGWVAELQEQASMIHVPYDLPHLQKGCLFIVPSGIDNTQGRVFRVESMQVSMIYPASITCEIMPEYETTAEPNNTKNFTKETTTLLVDNEEDD